MTTPSRMMMKCSPGLLLGALLACIVVPTAGCWQLTLYVGTNIVDGGCNDDADVTDAGTGDAECPPPEN
jgi:hypothetical protein